MLLSLTVVRKRPNSELYSVHVYSEDSVSKLKEILQDKSGHPSKQIVLYFKSICLEDTQTIADYSLEQSSILELRLSST
jgi:hypothetical protein